MQTIQQIETIGYFSRICCVLSMSISHKRLIKLTLSGYPSNTCSCYSSYWFHFPPGLRLDAKIVTSCLEHPLVQHVIASSAVEITWSPKFCFWWRLVALKMKRQYTRTLEEMLWILFAYCASGMTENGVLAVPCTCTPPNWLPPLSPSLYLTFHLMRDHHHHQ